MLKNFLNFGVGIFIGIYIGQSYTIPNIKEWSLGIYNLVKTFEKDSTNENNDR